MATIIQDKKTANTKYNLVEIKSCMITLIETHLLCVCVITWTWDICAGRGDGKPEIEWKYYFLFVSVINPNPDYISRN